MALLQLKPQTHDLLAQTLESLHTDAVNSGVIVTSGIPINWKAIVTYLVSNAGTVEAFIMGLIMAAKTP